MNARLERADWPFRKVTRNQSHHRLKRRKCQIRIRIRTADHFIKVAQLPILKRHGRDDVLRKHIQSVRWNVHRLYVAIQHSLGHHRRLQQILRMRCVNLCVTRRTNLVARTPNTLQTLSNRLRRLQLHDHVNTADIDPKLQRARTDQRRQSTVFEVILYLTAHRVRYAPVMRQERTARYPRAVFTASYCRSFVCTRVSCDKHLIQPVCRVLRLPT